MPPREEHQGYVGQLLSPQRAFPWMVKDVLAMEPLHVRVKSLLMSFGYLGNGNGTNPRVRRAEKQIARA